jgi:hypothetical protein
MAKFFRARVARRRAGREELSAWRHCPLLGFLTSMSARQGAAVSEEAPTTGKQDKRQAKADMAAAKARAKSERPWFKKKRFILPLALLLLIIIIAVGSGGGDGDPAVDEADTGTAAGEADEVAEEDVPEEVPEEAEFAQMGEPAQDGNFTFVVNSLECGATTVGEDFMQEEAQGEFCIMEVTVENHGDEAQSLSASDQYLYDDEERKFSSDITFALAVETPIFEQINPGNSLDGTIVFDVPTGTAIEFAELHDSAFSGGVLVDLR